MDIVSHDNINKKLRRQHKSKWSMLNCDAKQIKRISYSETTTVDSDCSSLFLFCFLQTTTHSPVALLFFHVFISTLLLLLFHKLRYNRHCGRFSFWCVRAAFFEFRVTKNGCMCIATCEGWTGTESPIENREEKTRRQRVCECMWTVDSHKSACIPIWFLP